MDVLLIAAASILAAAGAAHSYLGERFVLLRLLRRDDLPKLFGSDDFTRRTLRVAWHVTSISWWGFAALLVALAGEGTETLAATRVVAATFAASALLVLVHSRGRHLSWVAFSAVAALAWWSGA